VSCCNNGCCGEHVIIQHQAIVAVKTSGNSVICMKPVVLPLHHTG
jgi:hypothetical protein